MYRPSSRDCRGRAGKHLLSLLLTSHLNTADILPDFDGPFVSTFYPNSHELHLEYNLELVETVPKNFAEPFRLGLLSLLALMLRMFSFEPKRRGSSWKNKIQISRKKICSLFYFVQKRRQLWQTANLFYIFPLYKSTSNSATMRFLWLAGKLT